MPKLFVKVRMKDGHTHYASMDDASEITLLKNGLYLIPNHGGMTMMVPKNAVQCFITSPWEARTKQVQPLSAQLWD